MWPPLGQPVLGPLQALGERDASLLQRDAALLQRDATVRALEERALAAEAEVRALQASLRAERAAAAHSLGSAASMQRWALHCMRVFRCCSVRACRGRPCTARDRLPSGCIDCTMRRVSGTACRLGDAASVQRWALLHLRLSECCRGIGWGRTATGWGPGSCLQPEAAARAVCPGVVVGVVHICCRTDGREAGLPCGVELVIEAVSSFPHQYRSKENCLCFQCCGGR